MKENNRIQMHVIIGTSANLEVTPLLTSLANDLCFAISSISAGCTLDYTEGFWSAEGDKFLYKYENIKKQRNISIQVTTLPERKKELLDVIRQTLQKHPLTKELDIHSVHVETQSVASEHFRL